MKKFAKNNLYSIVRTNDITSEGTPIFKFATFDEFGRQTKSGEVCANSIEEVQSIIFQD